VAEDWSVRDKFFFKTGKSEAFCIFIYLFYLIHETTPSLRDMRPRKYKGKVQSPALGREATTAKKSSALGSALRASRGGTSPPYKRMLKRKNIQKRSKLSFAPRGCSFHRLSCHPLVYSRGMSSILVRPVSPPLTAPEALQTAFPPGVC
jgi:hypothetical protein